MECVKNLVAVRGGGDLASGVVHRLVCAGFSVVILEIPKPRVIRRSVAFAQAAYDGEAIVEGLCTVKAADPSEVEGLLAVQKIPLLVDEEAACLSLLKPEFLVDAILAKRNLGTVRGMAPIVIALGPGFIAGSEVDAVVETNRGHHLGRVYYSGSAEPDTGMPGSMDGYTVERVIKAPRAGKIRHLVQIADRVEQGVIMSTIEDQPVTAPITGVVRGLIQPGIVVFLGLKIADIDPRCKSEHCFSISDKARAIAGGVLEAMLHLRQRQEQASLHPFLRATP